MQGLLRAKYGNENLVPPLLILGKLYGNKISVTVILTPATKSLKLC